MVQEYIQQLLPVAAVGLTALTYLHSRKTRREIHKVEFSVLQRQTVLDLIDAIRASKTYYCVYNDRGAHLLNGVDAIDLLWWGRAQPVKEMASYDVLDWSNSVHAYPYLRFIDNPRLPTSIADALRPFDCRGEVAISKIEDVRARNGTVVIGTSEHSGERNAPLGELTCPRHATSYQSWQAYVENCRVLRQTVESWLEKNQIADVNL